MSFVVHAHAVGFACGFSDFDFKLIERSTIKGSWLIKALVFRGSDGSILDVYLASFKCLRSSYCSFLMPCLKLSCLTVCGFDLNNGRFTRVFHFSILYILEIMQIAAWKVSPACNALGLSTLSLILYVFKL